MSQPERDTLESVEKLLAERQKIAGWMTALDERRHETSPAVYQRVLDDYTLKLDKVQAKLVATSDAVRLVAAEMAGRLIDKEQVLAGRSEERAEAELRAAVGEFSEREWEKRRTRLDEEIASATGERDALRDELGRLRAVLGEVAGATEPAEPDAPSSAEPEPLVELEQAASSRPTPSVSTEAQTSEPDRPVISIQEQSFIAPVERAMPLEPSFDELAFLKTVGGRPTPMAAPRISVNTAQPVVPPEPPRASKSASEVPEPPLEYPDPMPEPRVSQEMTPPRESFFGRPTPRSSEAIKSLKCQECGTLNFPTEWYCERCGGELAAM